MEEIDKVLFGLVLGFILYDLHAIRRDIKKLKAEK